MLSTYASECSLRHFRNKVESAGIVGAQLVGDLVGVDNPEVHGRLDLQRNIVLCDDWLPRHRGNLGLHVDQHDRVGDGVDYIDAGR